MGPYTIRKPLGSLFKYASSKTRSVSTFCSPSHKSKPRPIYFAGIILSATIISSRSRVVTPAATCNSCLTRRSRSVMPSIYVLDDRSQFISSSIKSGTAITGSVSLTSTAFATRAASTPSPHALSDARDSHSLCSHIGPTTALPSTIRLRSTRKSSSLPLTTTKVKHFRLLPSTTSSRGSPIIWSSFACTMSPVCSPSVRTPTSLGISWPLAVPPRLVSFLLPYSLPTATLPCRTTQTTRAAIAASGLSNAESCSLAVIETEFADVEEGGGLFTVPFSPN